MTGAGARIDYTVRRSARTRRPRVVVTRDGAVMVTLPDSAPERLAAELVRDTAAWIERHRSRILTSVAELRQRPSLEHGRLIPLEGVPHTLTTRADPGSRRSTVTVNEPEREIVLHTAPGDERPPASVLEAWLRDRARARITACVAVRSSQLAVVPRGIRIADQGSRWGSASRRGTLSFSWRLVLAPRDVLDYVVVHEVTHLLSFDHSPRYWHRVRTLSPHVDAARRWLRDNADALRHALD